MQLRNLISELNSILLYPGLAVYEYIYLVYIFMQIPRITITYKRF